MQVRSSILQHLLHQTICMAAHGISCAVCMTRAEYHQGSVTLEGMTAAAGEVDRAHLHIIHDDILVPGPAQGAAILAQLEEAPPLAVGRRGLANPGSLHPARLQRQRPDSVHLYSSWLPRSSRQAEPQSAARNVFKTLHQAPNSQAHNHPVAKSRICLCQTAQAKCPKDFLMST